LKNLLTDISGVQVGHADDAKLASGVTAVIFDKPAVAAIDVRGGGPGTREEAALDLANTLERVDAIALSGARRLGWMPRAACRRGSPNRARLSDPRGGRSDRTGRHLLRSLERRKQSLGALSAVSRPRLRGGRGGGDRFRARQRRRRAWRHHR